MVPEEVVLCKCGTPFKLWYAMLDNGVGMVEQVKVFDCPKSRIWNSWKHYRIDGSPKTFRGYLLGWAIVFLLLAAVLGGLIYVSQ